MCVDPVSVDVTLPSDLSEARLLQERIEEELRACRYGERDVFAIKLAVEEALVNAIKHGNQMDPDKVVHVAYQITCDRFDIRITDEGPDYGVTVSVTIKNTGQAGSITIMPEVSTSEGEWDRTQSLHFDAGEVKSLDYFFKEPSMNAENIHYGVSVFPSASR